MEHTLKDVQTKLAEEQQRLAHLREAFQVQYCADELDAAGLLATAHLAQSRAAHSAERIRGLQSLLDFRDQNQRRLAQVQPVLHAKRPHHTMPPLSSEIRSPIRACRMAM